MCPHMQALKYTVDTSAEEVCTAESVPDGNTNPATDRHKTEKSSCLFQQKRHPLA